MKFWDLLYNRYGNPLELLQQMLYTGQLCEFIDELGSIIWEEKAHKDRWEFWLHRVYDMDFNEYVQACERTVVHKPETIDKDRMTEIVKHSLEILGK